MHKNQLQELAQRSCFNLPAYACIREGPDHAPRFKATVNFNGETFESPTFCSTLRQAEHAAAEVALNTLAKRGPSRALAARVLDETGVYKNLLQETAHRAGLNLPVYTTVRSGPGHVPLFLCTVEIAGMSFSGEPARTKKQAQKNAAMAAWSTLKKMSKKELPTPASSSASELKINEEQEQVIIARVLASLQPSQMKNLENSHQKRGQKFIPTSSETVLPPLGIYHTRCRNWGYSSFSPHMSMYHIWQQEQTIQHQNHLLALSVPPAIPPASHIYPLMQSMLLPDHCLYFPARELESVPLGPNFTISASNPSFCFPENMVSNFGMGRSTVTISEIQEEKTEESSEYSASAVQDSPVNNIVNKTRILETCEEDGKFKLCGSKSSTGNVHLEANRAGKFEWASQKSEDLRHMAVDIQSQKAPDTDPSHSFPTAESKPNPNGSFRPTLSSPVRIRGTGSSSSAGPRPQHILKMRTGVPPRSCIPVSERYGIRGEPPPLFMAPPVRIRSVVPVCSAPPRTANPSQEEVPQKVENKDLKPGNI